MYVRSIAPCPKAGGNLFFCGGHKIGSIEAVPKLQFLEPARLLRRKK
jgi:hypothetical protein